MNNASNTDSKQALQKYHEEFYEADCATQANNSS